MSDEKVGGIYYTVEARTAALLTAQRDVDSSTTKMQKGFDNTDKSVEQLNSSFMKLSSVASAVMAALSASQVLSYANAWTELSNKLVNAVRANETLADVTERVFKVAQATRTEVGATATLYSRLEKATREYNVSADDLARLTTIINKGFVVSGATAEEAAGAITQLSQGLGSGVLRGDEFNTVAENGTRIAQALADSLGVNVGQLRAMAAQGKLTTKVVVDGLLKQGTVIGAEFEKTTKTWGQSFTVATNNAIKFVGESTAVQSTIAAIGDAVVTVSENLDHLSGVFVALAAVTGSRFAGAMLAAATATVKHTIASVADARAIATEAKAAEYAATAAVRKAVADKDAALSAVALAQAEYNVARGSQAEATALNNLLATKTAAVTASAELVVAERAQVAAMSASTAAARNASVALNTLKAGMTLLGGPAGVIMLAVSALFMWYQNAKQAKEEAISLADQVDELEKSYKNLNRAQLTGQQAKLEESMIAQRDAIADLKDEVEDSARVVEMFGNRLERVSKDSPAHVSAQAAYEEAVRKNKVAVADLDVAEQKLAKTGSLLGKVNDWLAGGMDQLSARAQTLAGDIAAITAKKPEERSKKGDDYLAQLRKENELLAISDKRQRAVTEARQKALSAGVIDNSPQLKEIEEMAARNFDLEQAERGQAKATKASAKAESQAEQAEKRRQKTLQDLTDEIAVAELKSKGLNREAAQLAAIQDLGPGASDGEVDKAKEQAGQIFDIQQAAADKKAALERDSITQANKVRTDDLAQLQRQLAAGVVSFEQAEQRKAEIAADYTKKIAEASAASVVSPQMEMAGSVDPIQQAANEYAQKLALMQAYEQAEVITHSQAVALKNAADTQYEQQRLAAIEQQYRAQSELNDFTMSMIDTVGQRGANMITGLVTGTQSLTDAARNLAATILNQAVGALAQMGIQAMKNAVIGEAASSAAVAQAAISGPAIAAAYAPAASMVSLASYGSNAIAAQAGIASTMGMTKMLSLSGGRRYGGGVSAGNMYRVNENGQSEVFQNSAGQQMFIPGQSGKVVPADGSGSAPVNVIINNTAPNTTVENQGYNPDTRTVMLAVKEVAKQLRNRSGDVARSLGESWNVTGKTR